MARTKVAAAVGEEGVNSTAPAPQVRGGEALPPMVQDAPVVGRYERDTTKPQLKAKRYQVTRGGSILMNGYRSVVKDGKILDDGNFNIEKLREQGIQLQELKD